MKTGIKYRGRAHSRKLTVIFRFVLGLSTLNPASAAAPAKPAVATAAPTEFPAQGRVIANADGFAVLSRRARIEPENRILVERLEKLPPRLMTETNFDMWLVINREYAEDPVYFSLVPQPSMAARRTTMLVFNRKANGSVERLSVNRYPLGAPYHAAWSGSDLPEQWRTISELVGSKDPQRIGINVSRHWPVADGLTKGLHEQSLEALPPAYQSRLVPAQDLVVRWLGTRFPSEIDVYTHIVAIARGVIAEAFSSRVITPGVTTTHDVSWYIRERFESLDLPAWFTPDVNSQRASIPCERDQDFCGHSGVIQRGDVLHTDVGFCYLKLCTDTQEIGYVLRVCEETLPAGFLAAMRTRNLWQGLLVRDFRSGRTGDEVLAVTRAAADRAGIVNRVYTHALGFFGHAPGPTIGMWDNQGPTGVQGDWKLHPNTAYVVEGKIKRVTPERNGQWVQMRLEQSAIFDGERVIYAAGRQTEWHVIR